MRRRSVKGTHAARRLLDDIDDVLATMQRYRAHLRAVSRS